MRLRVALIVMIGILLGGCDKFKWDPPPVSEVVAAPVPESRLGDPGGLELRSVRLSQKV